ncbi:outer membrane beta-barrel family protein [Flavihumibacter sp. ZG627]|uniref:outer membrane beta-barrel family protein n=1 Tax=Flavihumibacter sp. ZG627 TaxID=1463156 RepID=UPI00057DDEEF|nr:outer membrane beta-barrel family protein [Flavihumibacter sp. ZG627]KIC91840.1 hypothetical protein HY58_06395 [Flavihumibacter sp. ZG627]
MRKLLFLFCSLLFAGAIYSQSITVKGQIADTSEKKPLSNAVVAILSKDSVLLKHTRTGEDGRFTLTATGEGPFIMLVTYPKFADFMDQLAPKEPVLDLGGINLIKKSVLLEEVIVSRKIGAIRMRGDTLEFKADSFAVREGANVEELLKKLPGLQVNKNGEITAQGEKVQKVLVDGEEFFSDDPAVVTQNLRADAIDNVQVFDKKSDQAAFTGIDDGEKTKTINLTLKEDRKKGLFGRVKIAGGIPGYFENEAMINLFKGKRKMAAYGTMSNTGKAGLNWEDQEKFGGGSDMEFNEEEGYFFSYNEGDEFNTWGGRYNGEGLPKAWNAGAHYSNKWDNDKKNLNGSYQFYKQDVLNEGTTTSQFILPDTLYYNDQRRKTFSQNIRHQAGGFYDLKLDSLSNIKITVKANRTNAINQSDYLSRSLSEERDLVNEQQRQLFSKGQKDFLNARAIWRKQFAKKGRTLSVNFDQSYNANETEGQLLAINEFFNNGGIKYRTDTTDQFKENYQQSNAIGGKFTYTEPISKKWFIVADYGYRVNNSKSLRSSFNKDNAGKYAELDSLFSSNYAFDFNTHSAGLNFRHNGTKLVASFGSGISFADFRQTDLVTDTAYKYNFTNFFPRANIRFKMGAQRSLSLNYNGNTRQPNLQQLQPVRENTDPLNIQVGNPDLKQEFRHNINFNFNEYKVLSGRYMYINSGINLVDNAISSSTNLDNEGKRTSMFINMDGNYNYYSSAGLWMQFKKISMNVNSYLFYNGGKNNNLVNGVKNTNNYSNMGLRLGVGKSKEKKYNINLEFGPQLTQSKSSVRPDVITRFWTASTELNGMIYLPHEFEISNELSYNYRQKTDVFGEDRNVWLWNAYVAKKFWKNKNGELRFSMNDILNQNIGFQRNASSNFISENTYLSLRRYWLMSFIWNFNRSPGGK